ncbi:hypothetical protein AMS59_15880 [Lysinibacillus sp. FJAT-14745]|uniref:hypothetical protein n=1 Tax=Lysinibacillus sp. FJAT-14745 TaxID=1704289 RepID=UPI0006AB924C|nr:hypothetical protein [Lysinibacillus sp. FJAT-14745]KOP72409.1 hypothetical protein AMS59_15880 [Lysinibacillus sp. FJAT-14745]
MKKTIITSLAILISIGGLTTALASTKTGISQDELTYLKSINPSITMSEGNSLKQQRKQLDDLHKQVEELEFDYGILVDNTKNPNKEPKKLDELTAEKRKKHSQLIDKVWSKELQFLDAQYKAGLIKEDDYKIEKKNFEELRDNN